MNKEDIFWRRDISSGNTPYKIRMMRGEFVDTNRRGREVPYKLYIPDTAENIEWPLVLWSHGFGGSRDGAGFIARFISGHGYAVLNMQHPGTDSSLWEGKPGHPWDILRNSKMPRKYTLDRFRDVSFVIDILGRAEISRHMDLGNIGMSGHSFGAITTQVAAGQKLGKGRRKYSLKDSRVKAGIAYSPSHTYNRDEDHGELYSPISIPMLYMTGTDDECPVRGHGYEHRLPIFNNATGPDQQLLVLEDGDHMVFAGSRGNLEKNPKRDTHEEIINILSLAFWDAYLKHDEAAREWLSSDGVKLYLQDRATYDYRQ
jgi:predicted dienelactone hydrolase